MLGGGKGVFKGPRACNWCHEKGRHLIKTCPRLKEDKKLGLVCGCRPIPHLKSDPKCPGSRGTTRTTTTSSLINLNSSTPPPAMAPRNAPSRARRPAKEIITNPDVEDENHTLTHAAFREEKRPDATFRFPQGFDAFKNPSDNAMIEQIASRTGSNLVPEAVGDTMGVKIFGNRDQCEDARSQLRAWSSARDRAVRTRTVAFPTVGGYNEVKEGHARDKAAIAESRKKYRADCDTTAFESKKFAHAIILEYKRCDWMDGKILGTFMEALDPIRMDHRCHITYMDNLPVPDAENGNKEGYRTGQGFFLCGNKKHLMDAAVERLKNLDKQINARNIEAPQFFLVKPVAYPLDYNAYVIDHRMYETPQLFGRKSVRTDHIMHLKAASTCAADFLPPTESSVRSISELDSGAIRMGSRHLASLNIQYIDIWLTAMLERLRCWQGYLEMRILIGTCAFEIYVKNVHEYSLRDFEEMVEQRNAEAEGIDAFMTTEIGDLETEAALLDRFFNAKDTLMYKDHVPGREIFPLCTAIFNMKSPWNSNETLRLKAVFKENGYGDYLLDTHQWELLESDKETAKKMVDIKLVDLKHSFTSTGISLAAGRFVTESQKAKLASWSLYERFLHKISVIPENAKSDVKDRPIFDFEDNNSRGGVRLLSLEQRKSYIFEIYQGPGRGYHVELFSFQMPGARKHEHFPQVEQRWGVQLWHPSWDTLFYDHQVLEIAMRANWEPAEWQFFPPASEDINDWQDVVGMEFEVGTGYQNMLDAVDIVEKIIRGESSLSSPPLAKKQKQKHTNHPIPAQTIDPKNPIPDTKNHPAATSNKKNPKHRDRRPDQRIYQAHAVAVAQGKPTGAAADLTGLEIEHVPVDETQLTGAARELAGLYM
ncbi:hypothetical protein FKW77_004620 [Venturia effusa]|uniref:DUF7905 domain-containing protein n=1 Tax=Venturia effusa TaxID=50376 RepID=A0A517LFC3_9PEZI|nr:hypothetical protein FKW77_004620 [Venturia effusa]